MYQINDVKAVIAKVAAAIHAQKDYLGELDGKSGDGDLGLSMEAAFHAVQETADTYEGTQISELLMKSAMSCNKAAPSTMGTLMSSGIMAIAKSAKGKDGFEDADVVAMPRLFVEALMARGGAKPGDKTILDALCPMADTVEAAFAEGKSLRDAFLAGADTAEKSAQATAGMRAAAGRQVARRARCGISRWRRDPLRHHCPCARLLRAWSRNALRYPRCPDLAGYALPVSSFTDCVWARGRLR